MGDVAAGPDFLDRSRSWANRRAWIRRLAWFAIAAALIGIGVLWRGRSPFTVVGVVAEADYVWVQMLPDPGNDEGGRMARAISSPLPQRWSW